MAQLGAEMAQLKDALARRQQIGVSTGLLAQRLPQGAGQLVEEDLSEQHPQ